MELRQIREPLGDKNIKPTKVYGKQKQLQQKL